MMPFLKSLRLASLVYALGFTLCFPIIGLAAERAANDKPLRAETLVLGSVSHNFKKHLKDMQPMVTYLADGLKEEGIEEGLVIMARNNAELLAYLNTGEVDLVAESPFSAAYFLENSDFEVLARRWKGGDREYHGMIMVRADSDIHSLDDLRGKKIAFEDPGSSSGYFLPAAAIRSAGITLTPLDNPRATTPEGQLGYSFAREEINTATWVMRGIADAGAISNLDWLSEERMPQSFASELRVLHETQSIPRALILVRRSLPEKLKEKLRERLITAHLSSEDDAISVLLEFQRTSRYEPPDRELFDAMAEIQRIVDQAE